MTLGNPIFFRGGGLLLKLIIQRWSLEKYWEMPGPGEQHPAVVSPLHTHTLHYTKYGGSIVIDASTNDGWGGCAIFGPGPCVSSRVTHVKPDIVQHHFAVRTQVNTYWNWSFQLGLLSMPYFHNIWTSLIKAACSNIKLGN